MIYNINSIKLGDVAFYKKGIFTRTSSGSSLYANAAISVSCAKRYYSSYPAIRQVFLLSTMTTNN